MFNVSVRKFELAEKNMIRLYTRVEMNFREKTI